MTIIRSVNLLHPTLAYKLQKAINVAQMDGYDVYIFETWRSPDRQRSLLDSKTGVTKAGSWMSWHQYGLAADIAFGGPGKWHWDGDFKAISGLFIKEGLHWGGDKDAGHYQYNLGLSITYAMNINSDQGVLGVWQKITMLEEGLLNDRQ